MRWKLLFLVILLLGSIIFISNNVNAAVIYGGKLYSGQNFTTNLGGNFRVFGSDPYTYNDNTTEIKETRYRKIIITSDLDSKVTVFNGSCESTYVYKYCFLGTYLDLDNPLTYRNGDIDTKMSVTVETLPPPTTTIKVTRPVESTVYCSQLVTIPISIFNDGSVPTNITYSETLPLNTLITQSEGGVVQDNTITFTERILANKTYNFSFTMTNFDCESKSWNAKYIFTTHNESISRNLTNLKLTMLKFYNLTENISPDRTNDFNEDIFYNLTFKNIHPSQALYVDMWFDLSDFTLESSSNGISRTDNIYRYSNIVLSGSSIDIFLILNSKYYGRNTITNNMTIKLTDRLFNNYTQRYVDTTFPTIIPSFNITSTNTSLTVEVYAYNSNLKEKYYYIYGVLKGVDDTEEPLYSNGIDPDSKQLLGTNSFDISFMNKSVNVTFSGIYRDKEGIEKDISVSRIVNITPSGVFVVPTKEEIVVQKNGSLVSNSSTSINSESDESHSIGTSSKDTNSKSKDSKSKDDGDFITRILEGMSRFFQSIFS